MDAKLEVLGASGPALVQDGGRSGHMHHGVPPGGALVPEWLAAANRARAFGMRVAFYDPYLPSGMEIAVDAERCADLETLLGLSDAVSIHAPGGEGTRGMLGARAFARFLRR